MAQNSGPVLHAVDLVRTKTDLSLPVQAGLGPDMVLIIGLSDFRNG